ncbi:MAG: DUF4136 domain-containing protein [Burkholderiaceae bacterium]|nr:DUF4136 domain-containing protein [Burkholderiaceae bacterium]
MIKRRVFTGRALTALAAGTLALSACSGIYTVYADVSTFGDWPVGRNSGSYSIERLPSQQQPTPLQAELEDGTRQALQKAGFTPSTDPRKADVIITIGARFSVAEPYPWDDPFWWHGRGRGYWAYGPWGYGPGRRWGGPMWAEPVYQRAVAILIRDRATGDPIYEARATSDGLTQGNKALSDALFQAAMSDFPAAKPESHSVGVQVGPQASAH